MSKQSVYTVHSGDECGGDPCYNVLKGPAGFECWLTEPEDRSFWRDLAPVVERLEHLEQSNAQLREQNRVLREALEEFCKATEYVASRMAYQCGLGAGEWEAFIDQTNYYKQYKQGKAALTATSQPAKSAGKMHACDVPGCVSCGNPEDATSQERSVNKEG